MNFRIVLALAGLVLSAPAAAAEGVDPLTAEVRSEDARRFVAVFEAADGAPTAEALQAGYLDGAGRGVEIFTPNRIISAENLAARIAADPEAYRRAIDVCLPIAEASSADLRSIYLGLQSVFPDRPLPEIHVVFGAGNSGGTAGPDAQVLGLEVICEVAETPEDARTYFRHFFAHETVHVLQMQTGLEGEFADPLLGYSMAEGMADFIAMLVTGTVPDADKDSWAREREAELWRRFDADRTTIRSALEAGADLNEPPPEVAEAYGRWLANFRRAPEGWPHEAGYWVGRRIAQAYFDRAEDKRAAIDTLLRLEGPEAILAASGYADRFE
ncbi:hypothetical protein [Marinicauda salina]|nr:hypothetical protein [Marinicauda salina]